MSVRRQTRLGVVGVLVAAAAVRLGMVTAQDRAAAARDAGRTQFETRCSRCHGENATGGENGPAILAQIGSRSDAELASVIRAGRPATGMPPFPLSDEDMGPLIGHLRFLAPLAGGGLRAAVRKTVETTTGRSLEGRVLGEGREDLQLLTAANRVVLLRRSGEKYRPVTSQNDWLSYDGDVRSNRFSPIRQIAKSNVGRLRLAWMANLPGVPALESTPIMYEGIMYVSSANEVFALDGGSGRQVWHFQRPRTAGIHGNAAGGFNRGVAVSGDRVFLLTDHAHILALNRFTGDVLWDTVMADWKENYNGTSAPLVVGDLVVSGTAGGDEGARGFIAAYDQATGREVWRFWTVPKPGEPGSETWTAQGLEHPSGAAWLTGSYDGELGTLYWPVGNPGPDLDGNARGGDNLYANSILALDAKTGTLKWYYQFTPHDVHDWDATEPPALVDANWQGQPRKLLLHGNRNGFFYVLDRVDGTLLRATPLTTPINWAEGIGRDGRPIEKELPKVADGGTYVCPPMGGGANWHATSFNAATGLYYVQVQDGCQIFTVRTRAWEPGGRLYMSGSVRTAPGETLKKFLRAINLQTGATAWEFPHVGTGGNGVLSTAGGVLFFGESSGTFMALDAASGKPLWQFPGNQTWRAAPMTYVFDNKQYVAQTAGQNVLAFALP
jgi:alcohol dehydrogenase (cytochrome c)